MDTTPMSFSIALKALKDGFKVARSGWNGKGMGLVIQFPDEHSKMTLPYIYLVTVDANLAPWVDANLVPWLASQTDLLAEDWYII